MGESPKVSGRGGDFHGPHVVIKFGKLYVWGRDDKGRVKLVPVPKDKVEQMALELHRQQQEAIKEKARKAEQAIFDNSEG